MKLTREDILKYGTKEEVKFLKEYMNLAIQHPEIHKPGDIVIYKMKKWKIEKRIPALDNPSAFRFILVPFGGSIKDAITVNEDDL